VADTSFTSGRTARRLSHPFRSRSTCAHCSRTRALWIRFILASAESRMSTRFCQNTDAR
jgi:hypothetical protein